MAGALPRERRLATREERVDAGGRGRPDRCADARSRIRPVEHVAGVRLGNAAPEVGPEYAEDSRSASLSTGISRLSHRREGGQLRIWQRRESSVQALWADDHAPGMSRRGPATYSRLRRLHAPTEKPEGEQPTPDCANQRRSRQSGTSSSPGCARATWMQNGHGKGLERNQARGSRNLAGEGSSERYDPLKIRTISL